LKRKKDKEEKRKEREGKSIISFFSPRRKGGQAGGRGEGRKGGKEKKRKRSPATNTARFPPYREGKGEEKKGREKRRVMTDSAAGH